MFTKESLQRLRERIDLIEVLSSHMELKRAGVSYKGLCPFHEEKSPSFTVKRGDTHYHCFGCSAHGDAIQFLMNYLHLPFSEAVETLAEKFHVTLDRIEKVEEKGVGRAALQEALQLASQFYHFYLLHTDEGRAPLNYLFKRGLSIEFLKRFEIGYAPQNSDLFLQWMREKKVSQEALVEGGLLNRAGRAFFHERITFPTHNPRGSIVGFSARKIREEVFGGKYINSSETTLFKKSRLLYGLNYCRRRIAKERRAIIVEGQIDCLRLIDCGLDIAVAALGTAFGESHVQELKRLGVSEVIMLFDSDTAGKKAVSKTGDLFQKIGLEVHVVSLPEGYDPDSYLREFGPEKLKEVLGSGIDYLTFQIGYVGKTHDVKSPAGKTALIGELTKQIKGWEEPVMIHESLRKLARLTQVPEHMVGQIPTPFISGGKSVRMTVDPNRILELDLLRWLVLMGEERKDFIATARHYLTESHFLVPSCRKIFHAYLEGAHDLLELSQSVEEEGIIDEILARKVNRDRADLLFVDTVQKLLDRKWLSKSEALREKMSHSYDESVIKEFDALKRKRVQAKLCT